MNNTVNLPYYDPNDLSGVYRGIVESSMDPLQLCRVRVRVPMVHGVPGSSSNYLKTDQLPWATPINPVGSGYDHGSCIVPEVGDIVFVMFEDNDRNYPLYLGGCYGKGGSSKIYGDPQDPSTYDGGTWMKPERVSEVPDEVYNKSGSPTGKVIYKSPKGATILVEEADGNESIQILDVLGQSIRLACSIEKQANRNNSSRRSGSNSYLGKPQNPDESCANSYSEISITDAVGQQIQMVHSDIGSFVQILSGKDGSGPTILLEGNGEISIKGGGDSVIVIGTDGNIQIESTNNVEITSPNCIVKGNLINYSDD